MKKQPAILFGPVFGELWWELFRFAPSLIFKRTHDYKDQNVKFIVFTRPDRFDIYGQYADILVPLRIDGDGSKYKADCFRLTNFPKQNVDDLIQRFRLKYESRFNVIDHIFPNLQRFADKSQFRKFMGNYKYKPRKRNVELIDQYLPKDKPLVILASRYRSGFKRNWPFWNPLYDLISDNKSLIRNFNFVICGKPPDYIPDSKNRFFDLNQIVLDNDSSLIGLTIETLKRGVLTVGSQSGIPNISLLLGTKVLEWGHQKHLHVSSYNPKKTKVHFLDDRNYTIKPEIILTHMKSILENK